MSSFKKPFEKYANFFRRQQQVIRCMASLSTSFEILRTSGKWESSPHLNNVCMFWTQYSELLIFCQESQLFVESLDITINIQRIQTIPNHLDPRCNHGKFTCMGLRGASIKILQLNKVAQQSNDFAYNRRLNCKKSYLS